MKVLFLTPWYPTEQDAMAGLFVQKHAQAVRAQGVDVRVLHSQTWSELLRGWRRLRREWGLPDVVQLNVIQKQGLLALHLEQRYKIPYIIVEHWSGYLPENGQFMRMSAYKRRLYARIARHASALLCVSNRLAEAMRQCGVTNASTRKINNVVEDFFYDKVEKPTPAPSLKGGENIEIRRFLHVSCFDERAKNVKGLLRAAKALADQRQDWQLVLAGTGVDYKEVRAYADELKFPEGLLRWTGELAPRQVAEELAQADVFVLPSNYENAPVVISESLAEGVPVISTRAGGIPEMISSECGILVPPRDDLALTEAMATMLDHCHEYDRDTIRKAGLQYSYAKVGTELKQTYCQALMVRNAK